MKVKPISQGFTLLEILLVVVIIGIMTTAGVNLVNSQSLERVIINQAKAFEQNLKFLCEKSVFENQAIGVELNQFGYQAYRYQRQIWQLIEKEAIPEFNNEIEFSLLLDGITQKITVEGDGLPQIVCQADGTFNGFELRFVAGGDGSYYALTASTPWTLTAQWHDQ